MIKLDSWQWHLIICDISASSGIDMIYSSESVKLMNGKNYLVVSRFKITLRRNSYGVLTLTDLSCLIVLPKIVNRIVLQGEKVQVSRR